MFEQILKSIFRFNQLNKTGWAIIDLCTVSAVLVALILFLLRYTFYYGILRNFGLSLVIGALWFVISGTVMTVFYNNTFAGAAILFLVAGLWFLCVLITIFKRPDSRGAFACIIISAIFIAVALVACIPGLLAPEAFENFGHTVFGR